MTWHSSCELNEFKRAQKRLSEKGKEGARQRQDVTAGYRLVVWAFADSETVASVGTAGLLTLTLTLTLTLIVYCRLRAEVKLVNY